MSERDKDDSTRKSSLMYGAVLSLVFSIISFLIVGLILDKWLNKSPLFVVIGIILGAIVGFIQFIRLISR
jgi:F0F1-type ATP synthase assembly protein I